MTDSLYGLHRLTAALVAHAWPPRVSEANTRDGSASVSEPQFSDGKQYPRASTIVFVEQAVVEIHARFPLQHSC